MRISILYKKIPQPAWDISERSQSDLHWERHFIGLLKTFQSRWLFCDVFKTSQKHLKKNIFYMTSLMRLENISKKMSIPWRLWDISKTSLASICNFSKIPWKNDFVWFAFRVITISGKLDVRTLETLKKWNAIKKLIESHKWISLAC